MKEKHAIEKASEYLGSAANLARYLGVNRSTIHNWSTNRRPIPIKRCVQIEELTRGIVTRKDLRPNDWHEIWPELQNTN